MKKLLQALFSLPLISAPIISIAACSSKNSIEPSSDVSSSDGAEALKLMSQLVLSGRHENMNFNINELISTLIAPNQSYGGIPTRFNYNNKVIDFTNPLSDYLSRMAPALGSLEKNGADIVGAYASYIMGMYSDDFYQNFQNNGYFDDTLSPDGKVGLFGKGKGKSMSILPGFNKNIKLSDNVSRKELAWGIQDNGALTNYLLEHGYDGAPAASVANTKGPAESPWDKYIPEGGTNCGGYLFYNTNLTGAKTVRGFPFYESTLDKHRDNKFLNQLNEDKIQAADQNLTLKDQNTDDFENSILSVKGRNKDIEFNKTGSYLGRTSGELFLLNKVAAASSALSNIANTESGTNILLKFLDMLLPIRDYHSDLPDTSTLTNIIASGIYIGFIPDFYETSTGNIKGKILAVLGNDISKNKDLTNSIGEFKDADTGIIGKALGAKGPSLKFMFGDNINAVKVLNQSQKLFNAIINKYNNLKTDRKKDEYVNEICKTISGNDFFHHDSLEGAQHAFVRDNANLVGGSNTDLIKDISVKKNPLNNKHNLINLLSYSNKMYSILEKEYKSKNNVFDKMVKFANSTTAGKTAGETLISSLNDADYNHVKRILGIKNGRAAKDSAIESILKTFTTNKDYPETIGAQIVKDTVGKISSGVDDKIKNPYEKIIKHIISNDEWKFSSKVSNFTSVKDTNAVMSFTLDYTGVGDPTSTADKQTKKLDDSQLNNFNPYQSKKEYFFDTENKYKFNKGYEYKGSNDVWDSSRTSGKVLGKKLLTDSTDQSKIDDALINYDGLGLLDNYKKVHHRYKVEWKNVGFQNNPYWVMSKVDCFNVDTNGKEIQFYNIY